MSNIGALALSAVMSLSLFAGPVASQGQGETGGATAAAAVESSPVASSGVVGVEGGQTRDGWNGCVMWVDLPASPTDTKGYVRNWCNFPIRAQLVYDSGRTSDCKDVRPNGGITYYSHGKMIGFRITGVKSC